MTPTLASRRRHLVADDGCLRVLAIDHRDSLRVEIDPDQPDSVVATDLTAFKRDIVVGIGDRASGVMLDPEYSVPQLLDDGSVPETVGVICALESQGYLDDPRGGNQRLPGWSPRRVSETGASAAKLLVLYRPDDREVADRQERLVADVVAECAAIDLPLFVEPVPYDVADPVDRTATIVEAARRLARLDDDDVIILKAPFPGSSGESDTAWADACDRLDDAAGGVPWATLSWGAGLDEFADQLAVAMEHGCSGFMAGRAIWRPALAPSARQSAIDTHVVPAFERLARLVDGGRPVPTTLPTTEGVSPS